MLTLHTVTHVGMGATPTAVHLMLVALASGVVSSRGWCSAQSSFQVCGLARLEGNWLTSFPRPSHHVAPSQRHHALVMLTQL